MSDAVSNFGTEPQSVTPTKHSEVLTAPSAGASAETTTGTTSGTSDTGISKFTPASSERVCSKAGTTTAPITAPATACGDGGDAGIIAAHTDKSQSSHTPGSTASQGTKEGVDEPPLRPGDNAFAFDEDRQGEVVQDGEEVPPGYKAVPCVGPDGNFAPFDPSNSNIMLWRDKEYTEEGVGDIASTSISELRQTRETESKG